MALFFLALLCVSNAGATSDAIYIASTSGNTIAIADASINQIMASVAVNAPEDMTIAANGTKLYMTDKAENLLRWVDTTQSTASSYYDVVSPDALASSPDGSELYVARSAEDNVFAMATDGNMGQYHVVTTDSPEVLAISPDNKKLYVASTSNNTLSVINLETDTVMSVIGLASPSDMEISPDGSKIYVASMGNGTVSIIDAATFASTSAIGISTPLDLAMSPDGSEIYVADRDNDTVLVVDTASASVTDVISVGDAPCSVSVTTDGTRLYVANSGSSTVSVIDLSTASISATITLSFVPSEIVVSAAPVGVSFRLNINSLWFVNFYGSEYTTTDFTNTYGSYDLSDPESKVSRFYEDFFRYSATNGTCFGMTASSLPLYNQRLGVWGYDRDDNVPANWTWLVALPASYPVSTVQDWVEYYQPLQYDKACIADMATYNDLQSNYYELKQRLASDWRSAPMLIGFSCKVWDDDTNVWVDCGHTVVPYEIQESADGKTAKIWVWDPNHPYGAINATDSYQYMTLNLEDWTVGTFNGRTNITNVQLISLDAVNAVPQLPDDVISLDGDFSASHLLFTGDTGGYLGDLKGVAQNSISGACPIISYGELHGEKSFEAYYVPSTLDVKKELIGDADGQATVSIYEPNGLVTIEAGVTAGSSGQFEVTDGGSGVSYASSGVTPSLGLTVSSGGADSGEVITVDTSSIEAGGSLSISDNEGQVQIVSTGEPRTCNLHLRQIGDDPEETNDLVIEVEADTTITAQPLDWKDISKGVVVEHDVGSDGSVDSTDTYDPTALLVINDFVADIVSGYAPLTVELTADVSGNVDKYKWTFGPSSTEISDKATISHTFKKPGTYTVTLSAKDKDGHETAEFPKEAYIVVM